MTLLPNISSYKISLSKVAKNQCGQIWKLKGNFEKNISKKKKKKTKKNMNKQI